MKNFSQGFSLITLLVFPGMAFIAQGAIAQQSMHRSSEHDLTRPYRAWVMCVDRSLSPTEEQFRKSLAVMEEITERDITYNDLVWVIDIQSAAQPAKLFAMPSFNNRRSAGSLAADELRSSKAALISAINAMSQVSGRTDLRDPLESALDILRSHSGATARILVIGSDFLTDTTAGQVSVEPPKAIREESAAGIAAWLLVTYPKAPYLRRLGMSQSELLAKVEKTWATNLRERGASRVNVRPVDSIPATVRTADLRARGK